MYSVKASRKPEDISEVALLLESDFLVYAHIVIQ